jgi:hypothetical protein
MVLIGDYQQERERERERDRERERCTIGSYIITCYQPIFVLRKDKILFENCSKNKDFSLAAPTGCNTNKG